MYSCISPRHGVSPPDSPDRRVNRSTRNPVSGIHGCHTVGPPAPRRSPRVFDLKALPGGGDQRCPRLYRRPWPQPAPPGSGIRRRAGRSPGTGRGRLRGPGASTKFGCLVAVWARRLIAQGVWRLVVDDEALMIWPRSSSSRHSGRGSTVRVVHPTTFIKK